MSNHFLSIFAYILKAKAPEQPADLAIRSIVLLATAGIHATYVYSTGKTEEIHIVQKYKMNRHGLYGNRSERQTL
jgi:hypothetical protein